MFKYYKTSKRKRKKANLLYTFLKERQKAIDAMMEKEKLARKNVENFLQKQEKDRQKLQSDTNDKSK